MINYRFYREDNVFYYKKKFHKIKKSMREIILIHNLQKKIFLYLEKKIKPLKNRIFKYKLHEREGF